MKNNIGYSNILCNFFFDKCCNISASVNNVPVAAASEETEVTIKCCTSNDEETEGKGGENTRRG